MAIGARIAATYMAAHEALPKMNPPVAGFQTLFAALSRGLHVVDLVEVRTVRCHAIAPLVGAPLFEAALVRFLLVRLVEIGRVQGIREVGVAYYARDPTVSDDEDGAHDLAANYPSCLGGTPLGPLFYDHRVRVMEDALGFQANVRAFHPIAE